LREIWKNKINEIELFEAGERLETERWTNAQLNIWERFFRIEKVD
jgi:hypothetical protein